MEYKKPKILKVVHATKPVLSKNGLCYSVDTRLEISEEGKIIESKAEPIDEEYSQLETTPEQDQEIRDQKIYDTTPISDESSNSNIKGE